jgi:hypothetical protein
MTTTQKANRDKAVSLERNIRRIPKRTVAAEKAAFPCESSQAAEAEVVFPLHSAHALACTPYLQDDQF